MSIGGKVGGAANVRAVLRNVETGETREYLGKNIITTDGDSYYSYRAAGSAALFTVAGIRLGTGTTAPAKGDHDVGTALAGGSHAIDGAYPRSNDDDTNNTGRGTTVLTWRASYLTSEGNGNNIAEGALTNALAASTACVCHFLFGTAFNKTSSDTLTVYVNHTFLGS